MTKVRNISFGQLLILRPGKRRTAKKIYIADPIPDKSHLVKVSTDWPPTQTTFIHRSKLFVFYDTPDVGKQMELFDTKPIPTKHLVNGIIKKH